MSRLGQKTRESDNMEASERSGRMKHPLVGLLLPLMVGMMSDSTAQTRSTDRLLVFISSFAGANDGAIQAFHLDRPAGTLTPARRSTGIAHPSFLALSPARRLPSSIHARQLGG